MDSVINQLYIISDTTNFNVVMYNKEFLHAVTAVYTSIMAA